MFAMELRSSLFISNVSDDWKSFKILATGFIFVT